MSQPLVVLVTTGFPYIQGVVRAWDIAHRQQTSVRFVTCEPLSLAREQAVLELLGSEASHLLLLEQHLLPPCDLLERLLALGADVAAAPYPMWDGQRLVASVQSLGDRTWPTALPQAPLRVRVAMPGCLLVARRVFEAQPGPWFSQGRVTGQGARTEAEWFSEKVRRGRHTFLADGRIEVGHWRHGIDLLSILRAQRQDAAVTT